MKLDSKWIPKASNNCILVLNPYLVTELNVWHLDIGCFCHMTREKYTFLSIAPFNGGGVVFGYGDKSQITEKGVVIIPCLP